MFPGAGAQVYYNEAGEPLGWDYPSYDEPEDPEEHYRRMEEDDDPEAIVEAQREDPDPEFHNSNHYDINTPWR